MYILTLVKNSIEIVGLFFKYDLLEKRIALFHFCHHSRAQMMQTIPYHWQTGTLMKKSYTHISREFQTDADGLVLNLLQTVKYGIWTMYEADRPIFKD